MKTLDAQREYRPAGTARETRTAVREAGQLGDGEQALLVLNDRPLQSPRGMQWILCPPVGIDYMNAYRGLRHLTEGLVADGHEVWRFDYPQTGASADPSAADQPALWVSSILRLLDHVRAQRPDEGIGLIGFRFGATLAALASAESAVDALICWSPVVKGAQLIRQTRLLQNSAEQDAGGDFLEAAGWVLNAETQDAVSAIDLTGLKPRADRVLILDGESAGRSRRLAETWRRDGGCEVGYLTNEDSADMLVDAHLTRLPRQGIAAIRDWADTPPASEDPQPATASGLGRALPMTVRPEGSGEAFSIIETAGFIDGADFAIHCQPQTGGGDGHPLVLFLNSGSNHQVGPNRLYITLSRRLAEAGIESLRLDLPGLGETPAAEGVEENLPYPPQPAAALQRVIDRLQLRQRPLVLIGLCSGAYHAFLGAIELQADIRRVVLINPLTFYWEQGMQLEDAPSVQYGEWNWYQQSLRDPDRWKRLLSGRINPWPIARSVLKRLALKLHSRGRRLLEHFENSPPNRISPSLANSLRKIEQRGVGLSLVFAAGDPGLAILREQAGSRVRAMQRRGSAEMLLIHNADHTLSRRQARQQLLDWFQQRLIPELHSLLRNRN